MYLYKVILKDWNMDTVAYISNADHWSQSPPLLYIFQKFTFNLATQIRVTAIRIAAAVIWEMDRKNNLPIFIFRGKSKHFNWIVN